MARRQRDKGPHWNIAENRLARILSRLTCAPNNPITSPNSLAKSNGLGETPGHLFPEPCAPYGPTRQDRWLPTTPPPLRNSRTKLRLASSGIFSRRGNVRPRSRWQASDVGRNDTRPPREIDLALGPDPPAGKKRSQRSRRWPGSRTQSAPTRCATRRSAALPPRVSNARPTREKTASALRSPPHPPLPHETLPSVKRRSRATPSSGCHPKWETSVRKPSPSHGSAGRILPILLGSGKTSRANQERP